MKKSFLFPISLLLFISTLFSSCALFDTRLKTSENAKDSKLITQDISLFYRAFELAKKDTAKAEKIFKKYYFKKGSKGLKDFYKSKIKSTEKFSNFILAFDTYYESIQPDISNLTDLKQQIQAHFKDFKQLYPKAKFPDVYFVVGNFRSNGTISKNGLLIGTEMLSKTPHSDTSSWNKDILRISMNRKHIPITVSHELIHFNQNNMKNGNTLLWKSIREGAAEFIAELISGETDGSYEDFTGKELQIWGDFKKDKDKNIWKSWQQPNENRPRNAGYWMGYMICKSYYNTVKNKEKAVKDILSIQDYSAFLAKSNIENYLREKSKL